MLTQIAYMPNMAQSETTLLGLRQLIFLWPALVLIAAFTMGLFYKLNKARFVFIIEETGRRKKPCSPKAKASKRLVLALFVSPRRCRADPSFRRETEPAVYRWSLRCAAAITNCAPVIPSPAYT